MKKKQLLIVTMIASLIVCFCPLQASYATKSVKKQKKQHLGLQQIGFSC